MSGKRLYRSFHGEDPRRNFRTGVKFGREWITAPGSVNILIPAELAIMGRLHAVEYDTRREGKTLLARHVFAPGCRPMIAAGAGRGQVFLLGTGFRWTDRGIVDFNDRGQAIDYHEESGKTLKLSGF